MSETETENLDNEVTDTSTTNQEAKFTQEDGTKLIAQRVDREKSKFNKKYDGIDVDRYNNLVNAEEERDIDAKKARGEFDEILKQTVAKKDGVIDSLTTELRDIKVNGNLLSEASAKHAINPNQVVQLLQGQVKLNDGSVEVLDSSTQQVRYTESGDPMQVSELVQEFLQTNPHFVQAGPKGSGTGNVTDTGGNTFDPTQLDMTKASDRAKFKEHQSKQGMM
jgi:hypothetical protein